MQKTILFKTLCVFIILLWSANSSLAIETNIPDLGQHTQSILSTRSEQIMGNSIMQKIYGSDLVITDPVVSEYLQQLAAQYTQNAGIKDYPLHFFGLNTREFNAFAFFGGHIAVHSGLMLSVQRESELAAVLAHETAHIAQHHLARIMASNKQQMPITFAEILAAVAIGALGSPEAGAHLATAALAGHVQSLINFTREHEYEADRIGIALLAKSHFDPTAMAEVFQRMKQYTMYYDHPPEYLMTHPVFDARIADAQNRAASMPRRQVNDSLMFHLAKSRMDANSDESSARRIARLKEKMTSGRNPNKSAAEYAYALALIKSPRHQEGADILKNLATQYPNEWAIELALIESEQAAGHVEQASTRFKHLVELHPANYGLALQYAALLLDQRKSSEVIHLLQPKRRSHFDDPMIHQMLARAYSMNNQKTEVHRSQAEWHFARAESKEAFKQLELALESAQGDPKLTPLIKDRKQKMKDILERQKETSL